MRPYVVAAVGFAVATVLLLAALPTTSWIVRRHLVLLGGGFGTDLGGAPMINAPRALSDPKEWSRATPRDRFVVLVRSRMDGSQPLDPVVYYSALDAGVDAVPEGAAARAIFLRRLACAPAIRTKGPQNPLVDWYDGTNAQRLILARLGLRRAEEGERLDPGNAFFPACAAVYRWALGEPEASRAALRRAVRGDRYDSYAREEGEWAIASAVGGLGEIGQGGRALVAAGVVLPDYAQLRTLSERMGRTPEMADLGALLIRRDRVMIGMLVGVNIARRNAAPGSETARLVARIPKDLSPYLPDTDRYSLLGSRPWIWAGAGVLLALFALPVAAGLAAWSARFGERGRAVVAHLGWLPATPLLLDVPSPVEVPVLGFLLCLALAAFGRTRRAAGWLGFGFAGGALFFGAAGWPDSRASVVVGTAYLAGRLVAGRRSGPVVPVYVALVALAFASGMREPSGQSQMAALLGVLGTASLALMLPLRRNALAWSGGAALLTVAFAGIVGVQRRDDAEDGVFLASMWTEADALRERLTPDRRRGILERAVPDRPTAGHQTLDLRI